MRRIFWGLCINRFGIGPSHYCTFRTVPILASNFRRYSSSKNEYPTHRVGESTLHPWLLLSQNDLLKGWFSRLKWWQIIKNLTPRLTIATLWLADSPTCRVSFKHSKADSSTQWVGESPSQGVVFWLWISLRIWSQNWNGWKGSVRNLWGTNFCKNPRKSVSLPCPYKDFWDGFVQSNWLTGVFQSLESQFKNFYQFRLMTSRFRFMLLVSSNPLKIKSS
jgi:hypothetical protein